MKTVRVLSLLALMALGLTLGACATNRPKPYTGENVSNIPHNRPESWEGAGAFGNYFPQSQ